MQHLIDQAREGFAGQFGGEPDLIAVAPGRVNLIGEHVDYHDGLVFPTAIDRYVVVAARRSAGANHWVSSERGSAEFEAAEIQPGKMTSWARYGAGLAWAMGVEVPMDAYVVSDLPTGAGLSSSAAMEMAFGCLYRALSERDISEIELARLGQKSENQFVGVPCGLMDQLASKLGQAGHALLIDIRHPDQLEAVPIPAGLSIVVCDTGVKHELGDSGYPTRRRQSEEAARLLGATVLRDVTPAQVEDNKELLGDVLYRRAKHIVSEIARVRQFASALRTGDHAAIWSLMQESHRSMQLDYEASCDEVDAMAEVAWESGCVGARITGGGFGGACVALVSTERVTDFVQKCEAGFEARTGLKGHFIVCQPVDGARIVA